MPSSTPKSAYWRGVRNGAPFLLVAIPFATLFGVLATEAGLNIAQVMGFSVLVIAGAAQIAAIQLMVDNVPTLIILATALAVNLRMAMYSAALAPYFGGLPLWKRATLSYVLFDQNFAVAAVEYEDRPSLSPTARAAYFFGASTLIVPAWCITTYIGALVGARIPPEYALDFALPITFLALLAPMMKSMAHVAAAATSIILTLALAFLPFNLGLLLAALAALVVGVQVENRTTRRTA